MVLAPPSRELGGDARPAPLPPPGVAWHDLECGRYRADLPLWRDLAESAARPFGRGGAHSSDTAERDDALILDMGAGTGRVALDLARAGHRVTAVEFDRVLLGALAQRAQGTTVQAVAGDARSLALSRRDFALCIVPMQTIQLLGGEAGRTAFLEGARAHLRPGGLLACAIVCDLEPFDCAAGDAAPRPEMTRVGGTLYISNPTRVRVHRRVIRIERQRLLIPAGQSIESVRSLGETNVVELDRLTAAQLEREGRAARLSPQPALEIAATEDHVGSTVVVLRA